MPVTASGISSAGRRAVCPGQTRDRRLGDSAGKPEISRRMRRSMTADAGHSGRNSQEQESREYRITGRPMMHGLAHHLCRICHNDILARSVEAAASQRKHLSGAFDGLLFLGKAEVVVRRTGGCCGQVRLGLGSIDCVHGDGAIRQ